MEAPEQVEIKQDVVDSITEVHFVASGGAEIITDKELEPKERETV